MALNLKKQLIDSNVRNSQKKVRYYSTLLYTFNNELSGEVDHVGRVAGQAGVGPTVGRPQAVEQDVAAEGHVLNSIQLLTIL